MDEEIPILKMLEFKEDIKSICRTMLLQRVTDFVDYCYDSHNLKPFKQVIEIMSMNSHDKFGLFVRDLK